MSKVMNRHAKPVPTKRRVTRATRQMLSTNQAVSYDPSFNFGVDIPISDVGSQVNYDMSTYVEEDMEEEDADDHLNDSGGDGNIFNILSKSGIYTEYSCPFCFEMFIGKNKCLRCGTYCHQNPSCSVTESEGFTCLICARRNAVEAKYPKLRWSRKHGQGGRGFFREDRPRKARTRWDESTAWESTAMEPKARASSERILCSREG